MTTTTQTPPRLFQIKLRLGSRCYRFSGLYRSSFDALGKTIDWLRSEHGEYAPLKSIGVKPLRSLPCA